MLSRTEQRLILFNKPYRVLCKFTDPAGRPTLADFISVPDIYPAGRLDYDSEGLVLLTNVGWLQSWISHPRFKLPKTYWAQIEGVPNEQGLQRLASGVVLQDGVTQPGRVCLMEPPALWPRTPPIRQRQHIPTSWISMTITEGRNRQVRRMTAAVGYPTLRLIRCAVGPWELGSLQPGEWRDVRPPRDRQEMARMTAR